MFRKRVKTVDMEYIFKSLAVYQIGSKIQITQALIPLLRMLALLFEVTQKLHTKSKQFQVSDFVDHFCRVTTGWGKLRTMSLPGATLWLLDRWR